MGPVGAANRGGVAPLGNAHPLPADPDRSQRTGRGFSRCQQRFTIDSDQRVSSCPRGRSPLSSFSRGVACDIVGSSAGETVLATAAMPVCPIIRWADDGLTVMNENQFDPQHRSAPDPPAQHPPEPSSSGSDPESSAASPGESHEKTHISTLPPIPASPTLNGLSTAELARVLEGRKLGNIRLEHFIGGGGMGAVFRGVDTELHRTVAVKVLSPRQYADEETLKRFKVEAQSAARLDHENIARVYYVGEDKGVHYIVFEYIDGINIRDLVRRQGPMAVADAIAITLQIADALAHSYRRNVVHRDIKPSNVLMTAGARAKLVDMGLARVHQQEQSGDELTASGVTLGTFDYISPEQARDPREVDVRSDLYSLGCTSFFMLTGQPPFPEGTVLQKLLQHQGDDAPDPRQLRPEIPESLAAVLAKMLAKAPARRYQQPDELMADLLPLARQYGLPTFDLEQAVWSRVVRSPEPFWRRQIPWLVPSLLLLAAVAVIQWTALPEALLPEVEPGATGSPVPGHPGLQGGGRDAPRRQGGSDDAHARQTGATPLNDATPSTARRPGEVPDERSPPHHDPRASDDMVPVQTETDSDNDSGGSASGNTSPSSAGAGAAGDVADVETDGSPGKAKTSDASGESPDPAAEGGQRERATRNGASGDVEPIVVARQQPDLAESGFSSLREAVEVAQSGDVIELRFDGPRHMQPVRIANKRLTIRAGQGAAPVLLFDTAAVRGDRSPRVPAMITVLGGHLTLVNLDLRAATSSANGSNGANLFETRSAESLHMDRCRLTLRDATASRAGALVDVTTALDDDSYAPVQPSTNSPLGLRVRMEDCVVIADGPFIRSHDGQSVHVLWNNGLFVSAQQLVDVQQTRDPTIRQHIFIDVQHLTTCTGRGLIAARGLSGNTHPVLECVCSDSIFVGYKEAPLVALGGAMRVRALQEMLVWRGDRNCYEQFATFWRVESSGGETPLEMDFRQWQNYWSEALHGHDYAGQFNSVVWRHAPDADILLRHPTREDFVLDDRVADQPALRGAADGGSVGFRPLSVPAEERSSDAAPASLSKPGGGDDSAR